MNKRTIALTQEQYKEIIHTMKQGFTGCRPNSRAATALILEANLGLRISDIVKLRLRTLWRWRQIPPVHQGAEDPKGQNVYCPPCPLSVHPLLLSGQPNFIPGADLSHHHQSRPKAIEAGL